MFKGIFRLLKLCVKINFGWEGAVAIGISSLAGLGSSLMNYYAAQDSLEEARKTRDNAQKQLEIENTRYNKNEARQDAFLGEVNESASLFDSPSKKKTTTGLENLGTSANANTGLNSSETLPVNKI